MKNFIQFRRQFVAILGALLFTSCAHTSESKLNSDVVKLDRTLVKEAVLFEGNAKQGAIVPEISSPRLRAIWAAERIEDNRLIEAHREWILEGDVAILGIPRDQIKSKGAKQK